MKEDGNRRVLSTGEATPAMMVFLRCGCTAVCGLAPGDAETLLVDIATACPSHSRDMNEARRKARRAIVSHAKSTSGTAST